MNDWKMKSLLLLIFILLPFAGITELRTPSIFSDNMIMQRGTELKVWGWAAPRERVRITLGEQKQSARTDKQGNWQVVFDPIETGTIYTLEIEGKDKKLKFTNILAGEVWLASGQSNMEWNVARSMNAEEEIQLANFPEIRLFDVPRHMSGTPEKDIQPSEWMICTSENIESFSAVAYFFGRHIHLKTDVPVGLINSSWGGTMAETWISRDKMLQMEDFMQIMKNDAEKFDLEKMQQEAEKKAEEWLRTVEQNDLGKKNNWQSGNIDISTWKTMELPVLWEQRGLPDMDGIVWFKKSFELTASEAEKDIVLHLGPVDDSDYTYVNGQLAGSTIDKYNENRKYNVPSRFLKEGTNIITVRVIDTGGGGGIYGTANQLYVLTSLQRIALSGDWKYAVGIEIESTPAIPRGGPNMFPTLLFNGMINGFTDFAIKGVIWYQGEANTSRAYQYREVFKALIQDWRTQFNNPDMPFLFVQLANFMKPDDKPVDSQWAELREAQKMALELPNTGMAVAIDIGEADDIHPRNKQDVGLRLALNALKIAYGKDLVYSGPVFRSMETHGNKIILHFDHTGSGLMVKDKYGYLKGFAIAGEDKVFHWARAELEGNKVVVYNKNVENPVAVRYAWGNNPDDANLYNKEGLPASPFRTDDFPGITQK